MHQRLGVNIGESVQDGLETLLQSFRGYAGQSLMILILAFLHNGRKCPQESIGGINRAVYVNIQEMVVHVRCVSVR